MTEEVKPAKRLKVESVDNENGHSVTVKREVDISKSRKLKIEKKISFTKHFQKIMPYMVGPQECARIWIPSTGLCWISISKNSVPFLFPG